MDYSKGNKTLGLYDKVGEFNSEQAFDTELNLPDYCPEIVRVIKCCIIPNVISLRQQSSKVTAEINAVIRLIYVGENGRLALFEQTESFEKCVEHNSVSQDSAITLNVNAEYVNCRAISPRKADIRSMLKLIFSVSAKREENILCSASGKGIQTMTKECEFACVTSVVSKIFTISEVKEIDKEKKPVISIINSSASAVCDDIKAVNNKVLIKGECYIKIYYICDEKGSIECAEHSMPISQIIEADNISEGNTINCSLNVYSCEVFSKVDQNGEMKLIDINVGIGSSIIGFSSEKISLITDAYSTENELIIKKKNIDTPSISKIFDESFTNKTVLESIGVSVKSIISSWCGNLKFSYGLRDDKCLLTGTYDITVIYIDSDGRHGIIKKPVNFDYGISLKNKPERISCFGNAVILGCSCAATGESRLEIKTEMKTSGIILSSMIRKYVYELEVGEEFSNKTKKCSLTVYFAQKGESVWNIARKYCTTTDMIIKENDLKNDVLDKDIMLMIPLSDG